MSEAIAKRLEADIEALFRDARDAEGAEIGPVGPDGKPYFVIANGRVKPEAYPIYHADSPEKAAADTLALVKDLCPRASEQTLVWRRRPMFETDDGACAWVITLRMGAVEDGLVCISTYDMENAA